jgi:predicted MFS family arabinose efflux permease
VTPKSPSRGTFAALSVRNFRLYFIGQLISVSGTWMQTVAQGWLVLRLTDNSATDLSIAVALQYVPMLLFASFGGLVADRGDKRRILYCTQSTAGILAVVLGVLITTHHDTLHGIFLLAFLLGIVNLFDNPARQSFVQEMVGRDLIANAVTLNSVLMNAGRFVGPALAGALIATVGLATCFYLNAASFLAVLCALLLMRQADIHRIATVRRAKNQLRLGLRYAAEAPIVRNVLIATFVVGTFAYNFTVTLPELTRVTFHDDSAIGYTWLLSAMGLGAVIGGLLVARRSRPTVGLLAVIGTAFGALMSVVAFAPSLPVAAIVMVPVGATSIAFVSTANGLLQLNSIEQMRGRVMSLYATGFLGTTPIGALLIGQVIDASTPRVGLLVGAVTTLATGLWLVALERARVRRPVVAPAD